MVNLLRPFQRRASQPVASVGIAKRTDGRDVLLNSPDGWEVDSPWLWYLGPDDGGIGPFGNPLYSDDWHDPFGYVSLPAVHRATSIICDAIAGLPWEVYRNKWELLPTPMWISDPENSARDGRLPTERGPEFATVRLSAVEFWTQWLVSALWMGDGYIATPSRDWNGAPQPPLAVINPDRIVIDNYHYYESESGEEIPPEWLIHLRGAPPYDDGHGTGVMKRNGLDLALALTVRKYANSQYASGIPYGYLKSSQPRMDGDSAEDLKRKWMAQHGTSKRSIAVLNATTEFVPLTVTPLDAQLADARTWSLRDIALAFGVPPYMLGVSGDSSTYANVEGRFTEYKMLTLNPWIRRVESTLDAQFPRGTELRVNTLALDRADTNTRFNVYKTALETGIMTRDEVRQREGLPPLGPEADPNIPNTQQIEGADGGATQPIDGATQS